jgi:AraC-like DNA-binding protein
MDLYHLGRLNVDGVIRMESQPSSRDILTVVDGAIAASLATLVILQAARDLPPMVQEAIRWAIEHAEDRPQVSELAAALALSPRVLSRETRALSLASPRALLLWGRLIRASHLLERPSETVESVAFHLGYATGGALGKALKRHVGSSPTNLLERGGLSWTLKVFRRQGLHPVKRKGLD